MRRLAIIRLFVFVSFGLVLAATTTPVSGQATPADKIRILDGFKIELVYSVPQSQGSWVSLTHDPKGRLIASDQYGRLYRIDPNSKGEDGKPQAEPIEIKVGRAHGLLCAFDSLYVVAHAGEGLPAGLFRVRDTDGDDVYDSVELLRRFQGGGEHGPHAVILSPDKKSLYVCGGNHTKIPEPESSRVPTNWREDQLLPSMPDANGHAAGIKAPGGWIAKTDPDGKKFELISTGYRNEYDIAFSAAGELFTYDADMEWDIGTPWYRPTRVCHVPSGAEFGWRTGTGKWPVDYPDSLPATIDIGPGSPTGIVFGTGSRFPDKYQRALFICDWSYGIVYAIHLKPNGATYTAEKEVFCSAPAFQAADITINPKDGSLYLVIGGRKTQSGLYRATYVGNESTATGKPEQPNRSAESRKMLESLHFQGDDKEVVEKIWPFLNHDDRFVRYAARVALEHQKVEGWSSKALDEPIARSRIHAVIALVRNTDANQAVVLESLSGIAWDKLPESQKIDLIRAYGLALIRLGGATPKARMVINDYFKDKFPADSTRVNEELCRLLIATKNPRVVEVTLALLKKAPTQEEQLHYVLSLSALPTGWTIDQRRRFYQWFVDAAHFYGGRSFTGFLNNIKNRSVGSLDLRTRRQLRNILSRQRTVKDPYADLKARPFVKKWQMDDLTGLVATDLKSRDFENGRKMFGIGQCYKCHRFADQGGIVGPDLTVVGRRFNKKDLLETLINPNKEVSDQYQATEFELEDGRVIVGRVVNLNGDTYMVQPDMMKPNQMVNIKVKQIVEQRPSKVSLMPAGLLDTLTKEDVLDLMAYLRSGGDKNFEEFKK